MKLFLVSAFGLFMAASVSAPSLALTFEKELGKLKQVLEVRDQLLKDLIGEVQDYSIGDSEFAPGKVMPVEQQIGLRTGKLMTVSVQPASGLQGGARGLTPEAEWREMFPHKPGYSR
jgi:hypothetical protein